MLLLSIRNNDTEVTKKIRRDLKSHLVQPYVWKHHVSRFWDACDWGKIVQSVCTGSSSITGTPRYYCTTNKRNKETVYYLTNILFALKIPCYFPGFSKYALPALQFALPILLWMPAGSLTFYSSVTRRKSFQWRGDSQCIVTSRELRVLLWRGFIDGCHCTAVGALSSEISGLLGQRWDVQKYGRCILPGMAGSWYVVTLADKIKNSQWFNSFPCYPTTPPLVPFWEPVQTRGSRRQAHWAVLVAAVYPAGAWHTLPARHAAPLSAAFLLPACCAGCGFQRTLPNGASGSWDPGSQHSSCKSKPGEGHHQD